jgi:hypothetical protein
LSAAQLIAAYALRPHPFEGHWREETGETSECEGIQLLEGTEEAAWHLLFGATQYELREGGPLLISISEDGQSARAVTLQRAGDAIALPPGAIRTLSCLGRYALFAVRWKNDHPVSDRVFMPDHWIPGAGCDGG